mgnify:CR=1 FL=1
MEAKKKRPEGRFFVDEAYASSNHLNHQQH